MGAVTAAFGTFARLRRGRALHPRGVVVDGVLHRTGLRPPSGASFVDAVPADGLAEEPVRVRLSRASGTPPPLPDVLGLAVRATTAAGAPADLLLSTAGRAPGARHLLVPRRDLWAATYTSITPFTTPHGLLMAAALPLGDQAFALAVATVRGPWRRFAVLALTDLEGAQDDETGFDPVLNPVPGLAVPPGLGRLRRDSYAASRAGRGVR